MEHWKTIVDALELHLFFGRIMKEHAFFLKVGFLPPGMAFARESETLMRKLESLLRRAISLSHCVVRQRVLDCGEIVTSFTEEAEGQSQRFTGTVIDRELTDCELRLKGWDGCGEVMISPQVCQQVHQLNREALMVVDALISLKERILRSVLSCQLFTVNYPLLIEHILREARLYRAHLLHLEGLDTNSCASIRDSELFWNRIMMEHALFIRGLLDPDESALIDTADGFADSYQKLMAASHNANEAVMRANSEKLTKEFRTFKCDGVKGITECKIRSLILPLLADHVLREANHYLRLLDEASV